MKGPQRFRNSARFDLKKDSTWTKDWGRLAPAVLQEEEESLELTEALAKAAVRFHFGLSPVKCFSSILLFVT